MMSRIQPTYNQMLEKGVVRFPTSVDEALQSTIQEWFGDREVCDEQQFPNFFFRTLSMSMRKYSELLSIEPGQPFIDNDGNLRTVTYDWLIQNYREKKTVTSASGSATKESSSEGSSERTTEGEGSKSSATNGADTTVQGVITQRGISHSGTDTTTRSGSMSVDSESGSTTEFESDQTGERNATNTDVSNGGNTSVALAKAEPQSITYANGAAGVPATLDWSYPGSQAETKDTNHDTTTHTIDEDTSGSNDSTTIVNANASSNQSTSSLDTKEYGSYDQDNSTAETHNTFDTVRATSENSNNRESVLDTNSGSGSEETSHEEEGETTEQENGRAVDIATLLSGAKTFILGSSAWDYLYGQIDKCFQGVIMEW